MSDDDLIRRGDALNACRVSEHRYEAHDAIEALPAVTQPAPDAAAMADRIEELEAENKLLRDAVYIDDLTVTMQASDRSKAIAAILRALDFLGADMLGEAKATLRATLAEIKGESHD